MGQEGYASADGYAGSRAKWGLVGSFLDQAPRSPLINLRSEELEAKPFYGRLLKRQRCLIPATAFFEWQSVYGGGKQKMRISDAKGKPLLLAGVLLLSGRLESAGLQRALGVSWYALLGGIVLGVVESWGGAVFGASWRDVVAFVILVAVLMFRPTGLLGETMQKARA